MQTRNWNWTEVEDPSPAKKLRWNTTPQYKIINKSHTLSFTCVNRHTSTRLYAQSTDAHIPNLQTETNRHSGIPRRGRKDSWACSPGWPGQGYPSPHFCSVPSYHGSAPGPWTEGLCASSADRMETHIHLCHLYQNMHTHKMLIWQDDSEHAKWQVFSWAQQEKSFQDNTHYTENVVLF